MAAIKSSPDWFARGTALLAIGLTIISLYFTYRAYNWQTKESLEERILVRVDFQYTFKTNDDGIVGVDVVNMGMHPIYVKTVRIEVPNGCALGKAPQTLGDCPQCILGRCLFTVYEHNPIQPNEPIKPLEPGDETIYTTEPWDFSKYPLPEWWKTDNLEDKWWVDVETTKKRFRQHPIFSRFAIMPTPPKKASSHSAEKK